MSEISDLETHFAFRLSHTYENDESMFSKFREDIYNVEQLVQDVNDFAKKKTSDILSTFNSNIEKFITQSLQPFNFDQQFDNFTEFSKYFREYVSNIPAEKNNDDIINAKREAIKSFHSLTYLYSAAKVGNDLLKKHQVQAIEDYKKLNLQNIKEKTETQLEQVNAQYVQLKNDIFQNLSPEQQSEAELYIHLLALLELCPDKDEMNIEPMDPQGVINQLITKYGNEQQTKESSPA